MVVNATNFTTGSATMPDVGQIAYNGVSFSTLFYSKLSGKYTPDSSKRTTKFVQYTLDVEGHVTLNDALDNGAGRTIDRIMSILRAKLEQCAATLIYTGRGFGQQFSVNAPGGNLQDVCWGPIPTVINFEPRGGLSAYVKWSVMFTLPEVKAQQVIRGGPGTGPVLEFTNETTVTYGEDWYSTISIKGTLEIPLTRPTQATKTLTTTVDDYRRRFLGQISRDFDLTRFRVSTRNFSISRDKRTLDYEFTLEELAPMGLPNHMPKCSGSYNVRPAKSSNSLISTNIWLCSLRVTYTVPPIFPRREAYLHFAGLWQSRMRFASAGADPTIIAAAQQAVQQAQQAVQAAAAINGPGDNVAISILGVGAGLALTNPALLLAIGRLRQLQARLDNLLNNNRAWPTHFAVNEGLYDESKQITFDVSWRLITSLSNILIASGIWSQAPTDNRSTWAASVRNLSGPQSWLLNRLDPAGQAIVDFGS